MRELTETTAGAGIIKDTGHLRDSTSSTKWKTKSLMKSKTSSRTNLRSVKNAVADADVAVVAAAESADFSEVSAEYAGADADVVSDNPGKFYCTNIQILK